MISRLSEKAVDSLFPHGSITQDDREVYIYGFFMLFSQIFFLMLAAFYGILLGVAVESILFYVAFSLIRGYAGGVHASKESTCTLCTSLAMLLAVVCIKLFIAFSSVALPLVMLVLSAVCILWLSPLDTEAKRLTQEEKKEYKKKSIIFTFIIFTAAILGLIFDMDRIFYPCVISLFLECLLLITGKAAERNPDS